MHYTQGIIGYTNPTASVFYDNVGDSDITDTPTQGYLLTIDLNVPLADDFYEVLIAECDLSLANVPSFYTLRTCYVKDIDAIWEDSNNIPFCTPIAALVNYVYNGVSAINLSDIVHVNYGGICEQPVVEPTLCVGKYTNALFLSSSVSVSQSVYNNVLTMGGCGYFATKDLYVTDVYDFSPRRYYMAIEDDVFLPPSEDFIKLPRFVLFADDLAKTASGKTTVHAAFATNNQISRCYSLAMSYIPQTTPDSVSVGTDSRYMLYMEKYPSPVVTLFGRRTAQSSVFRTIPAPHSTTETLSVVDLCWATDNPTKVKDGNDTSLNIGLGNNDLLRLFANVADESQWTAVSSPGSITGEYTTPLFTAYVDVSQPHSSVDGGNVYVNRTAQPSTVYPCFDLGDLFQNGTHWLGLYPNIAYSRYEAPSQASICLADYPFEDLTAASYSVVRYNMRRGEPLSSRQLVFFPVTDSLLNSTSSICPLFYDLTKTPSSGERFVDPEKMKCAVNRTSGNLGPVPLQKSIYPFTNNDAWLDRCFLNMGTSWFQFLGGMTFLPDFFNTFAWNTLRLSNGTFSLSKIMSFYGYVDTFVGQNNLTPIRLTRWVFSSFNATPLHTDW